MFIIIYNIIYHWNSCHGPTTTILSGIVSVFLFSPLILLRPARHRGVAFFAVPTLCRSPRGNLMKYFGFCYSHTCGRTMSLCVNGWKAICEKMKDHSSRNIRNGWRGMSSYVISKSNNNHIIFYFLYCAVTLGDTRYFSFLIPAAGQLKWLCYNVV